jgi:8-oxo-dGTP pyrophosphatase MutT (NUDIX family)
MPDAIPAATLVLFRAVPDGGPDEHLFVERAATMVFAGGAIVFPGGRVDAGDRLLALRFPGVDPDDAAARVAAIRETIEEAGVAIGIVGDCPAETIVQLRAHLQNGVPFGDALAAFGLGIDIAPLVPFARWRPNFKESRTFDTRFYLARIPEGAPHATVDETENVHLFWATAQHALDEADAGRVKAIFPTRRNLERLAALGNFDAAAAQAEAIPAETITPWTETRDGTTHLCIPEALGYPVTSEALNSAMRG